MTLYIIRDDTVTTYASVPAGASEDELRVRSAKEIETSRLTNAQMAAIWNALPRDGAGCQVQGPEDGGPAPLGGFQSGATSLSVGPLRNGAVVMLALAFMRWPRMSKMR
jgi:hypothetical protein